MTGWVDLVSTTRKIAIIGLIVGTIGIVVAIAK